MGDSHHDHPPALNVQMQDGSVLTLVRDAADRLVSTTFVPAGSARYTGDVPAGSQLTGFGPWPSWDANRRQGTLTQPDDDSGLFEPERLFVMREQYAFLAPSAGKPPVSLGPIDRAWFTGTEDVVQARQRSGKH